MKKFLKEKKRFYLKNFTILGLAIIILVIIILTNYEKNCGYNENCFNDAAKKCAKAKLLLQEENNTFEYRIIEKQPDYCVVTIKIIEVNPDAEKETIDLFQGKSMECKVPLQITELTNTKDILAYCSGPLKESIYELIIKKMYGVIAQNLGSIISEVKQNI